MTFIDCVSGVSGAISAANSLVGSTTGDGESTRVTVLTNGNYVVTREMWDNGSATDAGAVTFGNGLTGVSGMVSAANSLVGSAAGDRVGRGECWALSNGNYVVGSWSWDNGGVPNVGAVTFCNGNTGLVGVVSAANSLVGGTGDDRVGYMMVTTLSNGNYLVRSPFWDNGSATDVGAVTFCNGVTGLIGVVSEANSLVGSTAGDFWFDVDGLAPPSITALSNGNYVVSSPGWDYGAVTDAGAVTFGNGVTGVTGVVSEANSLVGSTTGDKVGADRVTKLTNGNYVVRSLSWDNGSATDAGAVTFGSGVSGVSGVVSEDNSLIGSTTGDKVGNTGVIALANGNFLVRSSRWDNGSREDAGAVTFGNGVTGVTGVVSEDNSLVGSTTGDNVAAQDWDVTELTNGNYVVTSPMWDNGSAMDAGAATFGSGASGVSGKISAANSLVGSTEGDSVGLLVTALTNGNYVVGSFAWDDGVALTDVGAVTFCNGLTGLAGMVSEANSLTGSTAGDSVGWIIPLANGNYLVSSPWWDNGGALTDVGAVTFCNGVSGLVGVVTEANSLVGSTADDRVGDDGMWYGPIALSNGNYVVGSYSWDNGAVADAGAVTFGSGLSGVSGPITSANSAIGVAATTSYINFWMDDLNNTFYATFHRNGFANEVRVGSQIDGFHVTYYALETGNDGPVEEGNPVAVTAAPVDMPGPLTYWFDFDNDGSYEVFNNTGSATHVYADDGTYEVPIRVVKDPSNVAIGSTIVTVSNAAPVVEAGPDQTSLTAGDNAVINATVADPGSADVHTATVDWNDGGAPETVSVVDGVVSASHQYNTPGVYLVTVTVQDDDGDVGEDTLLAAVDRTVVSLAGATGPVFQIDAYDSGSGLFLRVYEWNPAAPIFQHRLDGPDGLDNLVVTGKAVTDMIWVHINNLPSNLPNGLWIVADENADLDNDTLLVDGPGLQVQRYGMLTTGPSPA